MFVRYQLPQGKSNLGQPAELREQRRYTYIYVGDTQMLTTDVSFEDGMMTAICKP